MPIASVPAIDPSVFTVIVDGAKTVMSLFTEFPINVFLAVTILGVTVGLIKKLKR